VRFSLILYIHPRFFLGHAVAQLVQALRYKPEGRGFIGIFHWRNPSGSTMALAWTHPLTEMSDRIICWKIKAAGAYGWQTYYPHCQLSWNLGAPISWKPQSFYKDCFSFWSLSFGLHFLCLDYTYKFVISPVHATYTLLPLWRDYCNEVLNTTSYECRLCTVFCRFLCFTVILDLLCTTLFSTSLVNIFPLMCYPVYGPTQNKWR
jgi:hypothetical protein